MERCRIWRHISLWGCAAVLALSSCRPQPQSSPEFRIGVLATLSGPRAESSGEATVNGARTAVDEANEAGGIAVGGVPHQIVMVVRDHADRADAATGAARELINQEHVDVLVGPQLSEHAIPVARLAEEAGIPMISPMSTNPETTADKRFAFRVAFLDDFQGQVLARFAREDLKADRVAVLFDITRPYSRSLAEFFRDAVELEGAEVVAFESFLQSGDSDFGPQLRRIREGAPDVLFLPNYTAVDSIQMRQARELGIEATFLGGDSWDLNSLSLLTATDGAYTTRQWSPDLALEEAATFRNKYRERFGGEPRITAAMTYDAVGLLLDALHRAGRTDAEPVRDALASTRGYRGATGLIEYTGSGDPTRAVVISRVQGRSAAVHRVVEPR